MRFATIAVLVISITLAADAQLTRPSTPDLIDRLLQVWPQAENENVNWRGVPGDDAPVEQLMEFWSSFEVRDNPPGAGPSEKVKKRLLGGCVDHPNKLADLLGFLPENPGTADLVKVIYDDESKWTGLDRELRERVHDWLMTHSQHFRADLIAAARSVAFVKKSGDLEHEDELLSLAKMDWPAALPILGQLAEARDIHVVAVALEILAQHAMATSDEKTLSQLRDRLRKIADDRSAPPFARDRAFNVLLSSKWEGRDAWYLSLYAQTGWDQFSEGYHGFASPLETLLNAEPDRLIPVVVRLLDSREPIVHANAAWQLVRFRRVDALRPLLPALTETKNWPEHFRFSLLRALASVELPESLPAILKARTELDEYDRVEAAFALARQGAKQAPEFLKALIEETTERQDQERLAKALVDSHALKDDELASILEATCAETLRRVKSSERKPRQTSNQAALGWVLEPLVRDREELAEILLKRASALDHSDAKLATAIRQELATWPLVAIDRDIVARLDREDLDEEAILRAVRRLPGLRTAMPQALRDLAKNRGWRAGVAAALLGDETICTRIFRRDDRPAQAMLLAVARIARTRLPLAEVAEFMKSNDVQLARVAEEFLISDDTPQARQIVQARHPGELLILGGGWVFPPRGDSKEAPDPTTEGKIMRELYAEMRGKGAPDAIYALLSGGGFGNDNQRIIRIRGGRATLSLEPGGGRVDTRQLDADELKSLLDLIGVEKFDDQPPLHNDGVMDGVWYTYLHLTKEMGRCVTMNNPGVAGTANSPHFRIATMFRNLGSVPKFITRYQMPGVTVLWPASNGAIRGLYKKGDDFRVAVAVGDDYNQHTWHAFRDGKLAEVVEQPKGLILSYRGYDQSSVPEDFAINWSLCSTHFKAMAGEDEILPGNRSGPLRGGLWRCRAGREPVRITKGEVEFIRPITTTDGQWAVASIRMVRDHKVVQPLTRVRLSDGIETKFDLPSEWRYDAVALMPDQRILAMGWKDGKISDAPHWLVDPVTGKAERVNGDFQPFHPFNHPFQPTREKGVVWAKESDEKGTRIGRYDLTGFKFTPLATLAKLSYAGTELWVDEKEGAAYICPEGDLLRVELTPMQHAPPG